jgi:hypothetical protein
MGTEEEEVVKLTVGTFTVGIVGLRVALEKAAEDGLPVDDTTA